MKELILIIEDSPTQALILENFLQSHEYQVAVRDNGVRGMKWLSDNTPDLVISDILMPHFNGFDVCKTIKTNAFTKHIPVILLTSLSDSTELVKGIESGADCFVTKPYDESFLLSNIRKLLSEVNGNCTNQESVNQELPLEDTSTTIHIKKSMMDKLLLSVYDGAIQRNVKLVKAQEDLKELNERLELLVEERTAELKSEVERAQNAVKALQISEEKYSSLFNNAQVAMYRSKLDGSSILAANTKFAELFECSLEEIIGAPATIRWADPDERNKLVLAVQSQGSITNFELDILTNNNKRKTVLASIQLYPAQGYLEGTCIDITDRKIAEDKIFKNAQFLKTITAEVQEVIFSVDSNGIFTFSEGKGLEKLGFQPGEVVGKSAFEIYKNYPDVIAGLKKALKGEVVKTDNLEVGELFFSTTYQPMYDKEGQITGVVGLAVDVTESKKAEKALKEHSVRLEALLDLHQIQEAPFSEVLDFVLEASQKMTTSEFSFVGMVGRDESELTIHRWSNEVMEQCKLDSGTLSFKVSESGLLCECIRTRQPVFINNYQNNHPSKKGIPMGHVPIARMLAVPVLERGRVAAVISVANKPEDYTGDDAIGITTLLNKMMYIKRQQEMEEALRRSEEKFRTVADFTYDWESWIFPDGTYHYVSPSCKRITGYDAEDFLADHQLLLRIAHPEDQQKVSSHLLLAFNTDQDKDFHYDFRIVLPDGDIRWISHSSTPVYGNDGKWLGRRESNRDITDRVFNEEALRVANESLESQYALLNALINSPGDIIIFSLDTNYCYTAFNERHRHEMKKVWNAEIGVGMNILDCMHIPELCEIAKTSIDRVLNGEVLSEIQHQPDLDIYYEFNWNPIFYGKKITGVTVFIKDITERMRAEIEVQNKNYQLVKLNAEKDKFFSILAHDLRSPFNAFLGMTQIIAEDLPSLTMSEVQEIAFGMRKSANNLYQLLNNLLEWAQLQKGSIVFKPEIIDLKKVVEESIEIMLESARIKEIKIATEIPYELMIFADSNMIQTVIRNLVSNALKFTAKGGKIEIPARICSDNTVEISIIDSGVGMNHEIVGNLFRIDVQTKRKGTEGEPSTGLGLILCKEFVEKNGGKIRVESVEGKGSAFSFSVPVAAPGHSYMNQ